MAVVKRIAVRLRATVLAAAITLLPIASARAQSCSPQDWWNDLSNAASIFTSGACASACADTAGAGCEAAIGLGAGLGLVAAGTNQGNVGNFCNAVQTAINDAQNTGNDINTIEGLLSQVGISAQSLTGPILTALNGIGDPLNVVQCGCSLEQGVDLLGGQLLSCLQSAICGLQQDFGWGGCSCTPPPPLAANCSAPTYCANSPADANRPECLGVIYAAPSNPPSVQIQQVANGTFVLDNVDGWDGQSQYCTADTYCFCPAPLTLAKTPVNYLGNGTVMYTCQCPADTKPLAPSGPLAEVCICNDTHQPAVPPDWGQPKFPGDNNLNPTHSYCPTPLTGIPCPNGQIRVGSKCVAPCASSSEVMTPDGKCCDPNMVAACGQCCPPGMTPNPANGSCMPSQQIQ